MDVHEDAVTGDFNTYPQATDRQLPFLSWEEAGTGWEDEPRTHCNAPPVRRRPRSLRCGRRRWMAVRTLCLSVSLESGRWMMARSAAAHSLDTWSNAWPRDKRLDGRRV